MDICFESILYQNAKLITLFFTKESVSLWWLWSDWKDNLWILISTWNHLAVDLVPKVSYSQKANLALRKSLLSTLNTILSSKAVRDSLFLSHSSGIG